ncbi:hypothetical protein V2J09_021956 [Rumex salicifolius]
MPCLTTTRGREHRPKKPFRFEAAWILHPKFLDMVNSNWSSNSDLFQKSRENWLKMGDKNIRFFHLRTVIRRRRNRNTTLRINDEDWATNQNELEDLATSFFYKLYTLPDEERVFTPLLKGGFPTLVDITRPGISAIPTHNEIRAAISQMESYKASGIDDFQVIFFRNCWATMGQSACEFITHFFEFCSLPRQGWFKINTNGARRPKVGTASAIGIIRDDKREVGCGVHGQPGLVLGAGGGDMGDSSWHDCGLEHGSQEFFDPTLLTASRDHLASLAFSSPLGLSIVGDPPFCFSDILISDSTNFDTQTDSIFRTLVWVRINNLPILFYEENTLLHIISSIEEPLKVNLKTLFTDHGCFTRICVNLDLSKPLVDSLIMEDGRYILEYENLSVICLNCGAFGHFKKQYPTDPENLRAREESRKCAIQFQVDLEQSKKGTEASKQDEWKQPGKKKWVPEARVPGNLLEVRPEVPGESFDGGRFELLTIKVDDMENKAGVEEQVEALENYPKKGPDPPDIRVEEDKWDGVDLCIIEKDDVSAQVCSHPKEGFEEEATIVSLDNQKAKKSRSKAVSNGA